MKVRGDSQESTPSLVRSVALLRCVVSKYVHRSMGGGIRLIYSQDDLLCGYYRTYYRRVLCVRSLDFMISLSFTRV